MRDTAKVRIDRVEENIKAIVGTLKRGGNGHIEKVARARQAAELAVAPVYAPAHGAEFARAMLWFTEQLAFNGDGRKVAEHLAKQFDEQGVIWRPQAQVRAAHKQIGRLRSDVLRDDETAKSIPVVSLVYATDPDDFVGGTYVRLENVELPIPASYDDPFKVRARGRTITVPTAALRYLEGRMIRVR